MPSCKCPGREELARMVGFSGSGRGQTKKIKVISEKKNFSRLWPR